MSITHYMYYSNNPVCDVCQKIWCSLANGCCVSHVLFEWCMKDGDVYCKLFDAQLNTSWCVWKIQIFISHDLVPVFIPLHGASEQFTCSLHMTCCLALYLFLMRVNNSAVHFTWFGAWLLITSRCVWKIKITAHASMPSSLPVHVTMSNHCRWFDA